jgi:hypothetical protein
VVTAVSGLFGPVPEEPPEAPPAAEPPSEPPPQAYRLRVDTRQSVRRNDVEVGSVVMEIIREVTWGDAESTLSGTAR